MKKLKNPNSPIKQTQLERVLINHKNKIELNSLHYAWDEREGFEFFIYSFKPSGIDEVKDLSGLYNCLSETSQRLKNIVEEVWNLPVELSRNVCQLGDLKIRYTLTRKGRRVVEIVPTVNLNNYSEPEIDINVWDNKYPNKMFEFHDKIASNPDLVYSESAKRKLKQIELLRGNVPTTDLIRRLSE